MFYTNTTKKCETYLSGPNFDESADINNDDLDPIIEEMELMDRKILPISYDLALQFVGEIKAGD